MRSSALDKVPTVPCTVQMQPSPPRNPRPKNPPGQLRLTTDWEPWLPTVAEARPRPLSLVHLGSSPMVTVTWNRPSSNRPRHSSSDFRRRCPTPLGDMEGTSFPVSSTRRQELPILAHSSARAACGVYCLLPSVSTPTGVGRRGRDSRQAVSCIPRPILPCKAEAWRAHRRSTIAAPSKKREGQITEVLSHHRRLKA